MDIGRISSYIEVHRFLMNKKKINNFEGKNCEINGMLKESILGNNVVIGKNSSLESTIVYDNAIIEDNVKLSYCVVGENCRISNSSDIKNSVIGDNEILSKNTVLDNKAIWNQPKPEGYPDKQIGNPIGNKWKGIKTYLLVF